MLVLFLGDVLHPKRIRMMSNDKMNCSLRWVKGLDMLILLFNLSFVRTS